MSRLTPITLGLDLISDREIFSLAIDSWRANTKHMILYNQTDSFIGFNGVYYNDGEMNSRGVDIALHTKFNVSDFKFAFGGNLSHKTNKVTNLGNNDMLITSFNGGQRMNKEGASGYHFYGLKTDGVFVDAEQATLSNLSNDSGYNYQGRRHEICRCII